MAKHRTTLIAGQSTVFEPRTRIRGSLERLQHHVIGSVLLCLAGIPLAASAQDFSKPLDASKAPELIRLSDSVQQARGFFFGFLEFDWDFNSPQGVPGFDLLQKEQPGEVAQAAIGPSSQ